MTGYIPYPDKNQGIFYRLHNKIISLPCFIDRRRQQYEKVAKTFENTATCGSFISELTQVSREGFGAIVVVGIVEIHKSTRTPRATTRNFAESLSQLN